MILIINRFSRELVLLKLNYEYTDVTNSGAVIFDKSIEAFW